MKKIGLLLMTTIVLSGCSPTNGVVGKEDIKLSKYESIEPLIKKQKEISYIPKDVEALIKELKQIDLDRKTQGEVSYISELLSEVNYFEDGHFSYETGIDIYSDKTQREDFERLTEALDKTIAKGLKLYVDKNKDVETKGATKSTKIGRVWVSIQPLNIEENPDEVMRDIGYSEKEIKENTLKNRIVFRIQVRDVKDEKYKQIVDRMKTEDLSLDSIKIGKENSLIKLNNIEFKTFNTYRQPKPLLNSELFIKDDQVKKARISILTEKGKKIDDGDLEILEKLSSEFDFKNGEIKELQEIRKNIKDNKTGKRVSSSDEFNFRYTNLLDESYHDSVKSLTEIIIEKK